jgi:hypothetical protein
MIESIGQIGDRSAAPRGGQVIPGVTKMQLGDRDELSAQIRDYDTCFAEFLKPSGNGQNLAGDSAARGVQPFCATGYRNKARRSNGDTGRKLWAW